MIKRPIKYHFRKGKVKYDIDQFEDGSGWGPTGMYPRTKIFHLKTRQKLSENQITSRMERNFKRKRGERLYEGQPGRSQWLGRRASDELGDHTADVSELRFSKGTRTLKGKKAKKFYKRAKNINVRGKDLSADKFEKEIDAARRFMYYHS
tara:strand:- start:57 stop:506 length:450 start_codon:yes stop_codon:yes gene_type:complete